MPPRQRLPGPAPEADSPKPVPQGPALSFDDEAPPADAVPVARVMGAWGIKGGIKLKAFSADPQALFSSKRWYVRASARTVARPSAAQNASSAAKPAPGAPMRLPGLLRVVQAREQGELVVATCQELTDRDIAQALTGCEILISRASFPTPDDNEFYWVDLIGMAVHTRAGRELGAVVNLIETGPHCVLCIQGADAQAEEVLVPFVDAYVDRVDREHRLIVVDWDFDE